MGIRHPNRIFSSGYWVSALRLGRVHNWDLVRDKIAKNVDFSGVDLSGCELTEIDLSRVSLRGIDLSGAILVGANLSGADLTGANLSGAVLTEANLSDAHLDGAQLRHTDLKGTNLERATLNKANLFSARLEGSNLRQAQLILANFTDSLVINSIIDYSVMFGAQSKGVFRNHANLHLVIDEDSNKNIVDEVEFISALKGTFRNPINSNTIDLYFDAVREFDFSFQGRAQYSSIIEHLAKFFSVLAKVGQHFDTVVDFLSSPIFLRTSSAISALLVLIFGYQKTQFVGGLYVDIPSIICVACSMLGFRLSFLLDSSHEMPDARYD